MTDTTTTTTRPAGTGGIDLSGIDIAAAIFKATGGGYGAPGTSQPADGGTPVKLPDWMTNFGNGALSDHFDFSAPPADRDALIKLLADPEASHPMFDLFKGDDQPVFANGGPEGTAWLGPAIVGLIIIAAIYLSGGCDGKPEPPPKPEPPKLKEYEEKSYTDPDAMTGSLPSPAASLAQLLKANGIDGIDTSSIAVTDILGKLSDNLGKVTDLVNALQGAAETGDTAGFDGALADLMALAGVDPAALKDAGMAPQTVLDGICASLDIAGGMDGMAHLDAMQEAGLVTVLTDWVFLSTHGNLNWDDFIL